MKEIYGNLWDQPSRKDVDAICITTNGFVKTNGEAVMGRGCAKEYAERVPNAPAVLGKAVLEGGNVPTVLTHDPDTETTVVSFPVKPVGDRVRADKGNVVKHMRHRLKAGDWVPGWACTADLRIIAMSAIELSKLATRHRWNKVVIPRPGAGFGELEWSTVKHRLEQLLDDRFEIIHFKE